MYIKFIRLPEEYNNGQKPDNNNFGNTNRFQLDKVAFYGRTLLEYLKMFRIDIIDHLKRYKRILDCPSGASSFVAEANNRYGINTVGCDPLFDKHFRILQKLLDHIYYKLSHR